MPRIIKTCPGIGDSIWLFMKLINANEKFDWQIHDGKPQRGKQIFDLMPQISHSCTYVPDLQYNVIKRLNATRQFTQWHHMQMPEFFLSANEHLEQGRRIEEFLPDLPTSFTLDYATTQKDRGDKSMLMINGRWFLEPAPAFIGIYASAYSTQSAWNFWNENKWCEFIKLFHKERPRLVFVIIGASFDIDLGNNLLALLVEQNIPHINTIGQPLSVVIEILKVLNYFVGFPSGLSILNETLGKDGFMFYPPALINMMNAWADPKRIESGAYKGAQFCEPERAFEWIKNTYKIFDKI